MFIESKSMLQITTKSVVSTVTKKATHASAMETSMDLCGKVTIVKLVFHASNLVSMAFANIEGVSVTNTGQVTVAILKCLVTAVFVKMEALVI